MEKIWGLQFEKIENDAYPIWRLFIRNPFMSDGKYQIGLNRKILLEAIRSGVQKFILVVGQREITMNVPSEKGLKEKEKNNEFEDRPSMFQGSSPLRIYYFEVPLVALQPKA